MAEEQLLPKSNYKQQIIKKGWLEAQYGLNGVIFKCQVMATEQHLVIEDRNDDQKWNMPSVCIKWSQLINIDDLNDNNEIHSFQLLFKHDQYPNIYIYCDSKKKKKGWIKIFEKKCPTLILTKELQTVKRCAVNLGFNELQIESALITYHEKHGTLYNVHIFIGIITEKYKNTEIDTKNDDDDEDDVPKDLQCGICQQLYRKPVTNIYDQIYCYECIVNWFDIINNEQTKINDPNTNQPLPQHCRLLMPNFNKMVSKWNSMHGEGEKFSDLTYVQLQSIDGEMNKRRKKILYYLQKTENCQQIATKLADRILKSDKGILDKADINEVMDEAMNCYEWLNEIKNLIKEGSDIYNNAIKQIIDNKTEKDYLFKWDEPEWKNFINKNSTNYGDVYQVDDYLLQQIEEQTTDVLRNITKTMENQKLSTEQIKDEILKIILQKQHELMVKAQNEEEKEEKMQYMKQMRRIDIERIMYSEKHGLVNTKCMRKIAECIKKNKAFELYHNDWSDKTMTREQIIRFLQTAGMGDGVENQYLIYKGFAMTLKDKMFRLSSYLKTFDENKFKKFQYFRYLKSVDIIEQQVIDPKEWKKENDKIELKIKFDCDYDEHLAKYDNDKEKLGKVIKRQMMKQLKIKGAVHADKCIIFKNVEKGSIDITFVFYTPLIATLGGACDFIYCLNRHYKDPDFYISTKRSILQGMAVGGGIGAVGGAMGGAALIGGAAGKIGLVAAGCSLLTPVGLVIGCAVAGAVVGAAICGLIGWGIWKLLKNRKRARENQPNPPNPAHIQLQPIGGGGGGENDEEEENEEEEEEEEEEKENEVNPLRREDDNGGGGGKGNDLGPGYIDDNRPQREAIDQPGGGQRWMSQISYNIDDINTRIRNNGNNEWKMILDCNCEIKYQHDPQTEGGHIWCPKHNRFSDIQRLESAISNHIGNGQHNDGRRAVISVLRIPQCAANEFNIEEESDSDGN